MKLFSKMFMVFALVLGLTMVNAPQADAKDLTLVNKTGYDIAVMNCTPSISNVWYEDVLGNSVWRNGQSITLDFDRWMLSDTWDFKIHYTNGYSEEWHNVNVRSVNTIILHKDGTNEYL